MRAVVQRVTKARVTVGDETVSSIGRGLCVLLGLSLDDTQSDADYIVRKILNLRLFEDENGKAWSKSVMERHLEVLCVSQFTLQCVLKGNKPDFHNAMAADGAQPFYNAILDSMRRCYKPELIKGREVWRRHAGAHSERRARHHPADVPHRTPRPQTAVEAGEAAEEGEEPLQRPPRGRQGAGRPAPPAGPQQRRRGGRVVREGAVRRTLQDGEPRLPRIAPPTLDSPPPVNTWWRSVPLPASFVPPPAECALSSCAGVGPGVPASRLWRLCLDAGQRLCRSALCSTE